MELDGLPLVREVEEGVHINASSSPEELPGTAARDERDSSVEILSFFFGAGVDDFWTRLLDIIHFNTLTEI